MSRAQRLTTPGLGVLTASVTALALLVGSCRPLPSVETERATVETRSLSESVAVDAAERFLDRYLDGGRIVRRDQGGDTVSEGQAYGMLVAVALGDRDRFDAIWHWTRTNLERADGLLAWHWADGDVVDPMPATDADVDAAHALALAARAFAEPAYRRDAERLADAVVEHEVVDGRAGPVAVAGPWATDERWVNPSYGAPVAYAVLAGVTGDPVWDQLDDAARRVVTGSANRSDLPPDWARLTADAIVADGPPAGGDPRHGYDAARTAVRFAADCDPDGRALAAAMDDEYDGAVIDDGGPAAVLALDGTPRRDHGHPVTTVAAAAASLASGDRDDAGRLLGLAGEQDTDHPTYYGAAWVALGRLWLSTERLGGCARGEDDLVDPVTTATPGTGHAAGRGSHPSAPTPR